MRTISILLFGVLILRQLNCYGQNILPEKSLQLSDFKFNSIFGHQSTDSLHIYCLLGTGFFRTPRAENSDSLISNWTDEHPKANIVPVSTLVDSSMNLTYCLVVDKTDTLNVFLIKNGCFPGGTMQRPETWAEMPKEKKKVYSDTERELKIEIPKPNIVVHMEKNSYENYIEQIKRAEQYASENKLGIWKSEN